jgi:transaldolase/glucose-6-phosphate isomerase
MQGELDLGSVPTVDEADAGDRLAAFLDGLVPGDYVGIQAYLAPSAERWNRLQALRKAIGARTGLATTLGWGPRFLHSTGQLHKGGPASGAFVQFVDRSGSPLPVPESGHEFGAMIAAQAAGDHEALVEAGKRVIRIQLGAAPDSVLGRLATTLS